MLVSGFDQFISYLSVLQKTAHHLSHQTQGCGLGTIGQSHPPKARCRIELGLDFQPVQVCPGCVDSQDHRITVPSHLHEASRVVSAQSHHFIGVRNRAVTLGEYTCHFVAQRSGRNRVVQQILEFDAFARAGQRVIRATHEAGRHFDLVRHAQVDGGAHGTDIDNDGIQPLLAAGGLQRRPVTPEEMRTIEPALAGQYYGGFFTESDATGDIHRYTVGLAAAAQRQGVTIQYGQEVISLFSDGQIANVISRCAEGDQQNSFDAIVVCTGVASRTLAAQLGDRVNIYPVKGYSITVNLLDEQSQKAAPWVSLLDDQTKLVTSRLGVDRFRVAGTAEFNGYNKDIRADRIRPITEWVAQCFPGVSTRQVVPWAGLRPMMPNMMPRVGRGQKPNVFYNTGHGHLGWTLSAATAHMVAEQVAQARD